MKPIAISAIHQFHEKNNAILTQVNGWMMPKRYASVEDELGIIENFVGIHDISSKAKLIVHGDGFFGVLSEKFEATAWKASGVDCRQIKVAAIKPIVQP